MAATIVTIEKKLEASYVTQDQFRPVKVVVYGMVGFMMMAMLGAIVALVLRGPLQAPVIQQQQRP